MLIMSIETHTPEGCPSYNMKNNKDYIDFGNKIDALAAKHGIKIIGQWHDPLMHQGWVVYDTPNLETLLKLQFFEPEFLSIRRFTVIENRMVISQEAVMRSLAQQNK